MVTEISNKEEFLAISDDLSADYVLTDDIFIGETISPFGSFSGTLDGDGHTIYEIDINEQAGTYSDLQLGLFRSIESNGVVKNLTLDGTVISGYYPSGYDWDGTITCGGLTAELYGTIENVTFSSKYDFTRVRARAAYGHSEAGAIVGRFYNGEIKNCHVEGGNEYIVHVEGSAQDGGGTDGSMTGSAAVGGLLAENYAGRIENCSVSGAEVVTENSLAGGFIGHVSTEDYADEETGIDYCWVDSSVDVILDSQSVGSQQDIGGFTGRIEPGDDHCEISKCWTEATVISEVENSRNVGGFAGAFELSGKNTVRDCYAGGVVRGHEGISGFVDNIGETIASGNNDYVQVYNCYTYCTMEPQIAEDNRTSDIQNPYVFVRNSPSETKLDSEGSGIGVSDLYWDSDKVEGKESSILDYTPVGLQTSDMQGISPKETMPGFDYNIVWELNNGDYPTLIKEPSSTGVGSIAVGSPTIRNRMSRKLKVDIPPSGEYVPEGPEIYYPSKWPINITETVVVGDNNLIIIDEQTLQNGDSLSARTIDVTSDLGPVTCHPDGDVFFTAGGNIHRVLPDGTYDGEYISHGYSMGSDFMGDSMKVDDNKNLYVSMDNEFIIYDSNGDVAFDMSNHTSDDTNNLQVTVGPSGQFVVAYGESPTTVKHFDSSWTEQMSNEISGSGHPASLDWHDNHLYLLKYVKWIDSNSHLVKISNSDGSELWRFSDEPIAPRTFALDNGDVVASTGDGVEQGEYNTEYIAGDGSRQWTTNTYSDSRIRARTPSAPYSNVLELMGSQELAVIKDGIKVSGYDFSGYTDTNNMTLEPRVGRYGVDPTQWGQ